MLQGRWSSEPQLQCKIAVKQCQSRSESRLHNHQKYFTRVFWVKKNLIVSCDAIKTKTVCATLKQIFFQTEPWTKKRVFSTKKLTQISKSSYLLLILERLQSRQKTVKTKLICWLFLGGDCGLNILVARFSRLWSQRTIFCNDGGLKRKS